MHLIAIVLVVIPHPHMPPEPLPVGPIATPALLAVAFAVDAIARALSAGALLTATIVTVLTHLVKRASFTIVNVLDIVARQPFRARNLTRPALLDMAHIRFVSVKLDLPGLIQQSMTPLIGAVTIRFSGTLSLDNRKTAPNFTKLPTHRKLNRPRTATLVVLRHLHMLRTPINLIMLAIPSRTRPNPPLIWFPVTVRVTRNAALAEASALAPRQLQNSLAILARSRKRNLLLATRIVPLQLRLPTVLTDIVPVHPLTATLVQLPLPIMNPSQGTLLFLLIPLSRKAFLVHPDPSIVFGRPPTGSTTFRTLCKRR